MNKSKGFTIIELLVVVAIIAVLTGIVLVNVTSYINKGKDAAIKGNLSSILINTATYYDTNGNYTAFCGTPSYMVPEAAILSANGGVAGINTKCVGTATTTCACATLKVTAGNVYCVDSTGYKKETTNTCALACPAAGGCV